MSQARVSALKDMLAGMAPRLHDRPYVFMKVLKEGAPLPQSAFALIQEDEGKTIVLPATEPVQEGQFARITLMVHSDLEGVGLTAAVSTALADAGIACNVIAAFHHDHLFVPWERGREAMEILGQLSRKNG